MDSLHRHNIWSCVSMMSGVYWFKRLIELLENPSAIALAQLKTVVLTREALKNAKNCQRNKKVPYNTVCYSLHKTAQTAILNV